MKQKTPLQQAIQRIEADAKYKPIQYQLASEQAIAILMELLPTEQQVIEDAYYEGWNSTGKSATDYFTSKFEK